MKEGSIRVCMIESGCGKYRHLFDSLGESSQGAYQIDHFQNLEDGIGELSDNDLDILLLELDMPESDGVQTLTQIKNLALDIPVIVIAEMDDEDLGFATLGCAAFRSSISPSLASG